MPESADNRRTGLTVDIRDEAGQQLNLISIDATEAISSHFRIKLDVVSLAELDLLENLGKPATVRCDLENDLARYFHGILSNAQFVDEVQGEGFRYSLTLVPNAYFHQQGSNFRIFQERSLREIVDEVLNDCGIDFEWKGSGNNRKFSFCVQYDESDFSFVSRLLEQEGIFYFYVHSSEKHVLTMCDATAQLPGMTPATLTMNAASPSMVNPDSPSREDDLHFVSKWVERASSGGEAKVTLADFNFMAPDATVTAESTEEGDHPGDEIEVYSFPGRYYDGGTGTNLSQIMLEARRAQRLVYDAFSQHPAIANGHAFTLADHPNDRFNQEYCIISCHSYIASEVYRTGMHSGPDRIAFVSIPSSVAFRQPIITPRPKIAGPETAIVTGPTNEEIHTDKYGRIKIHFHWDRKNDKLDTSSCWVRVAQTGGLGNMIIPRVGDEVLVDFINGDPDRPIVIGRLYNDENQPHYELPKHKTRAVWRTKTYKTAIGGVGEDAIDVDSTTAPRANELRFEDKTGEEELYLHAEKDMNTRVRNDQTLQVGHDRKVLVHRHEEGDIRENRTFKIGGNDDLTIEKSQTVLAHDSISIEAYSKITLKVGLSTIEMTTDSIKVRTMTLDMDGSITSKLSGSMVEVNGNALVKVKGGLVLINS